MNKLKPARPALDEDILLRVEKPARYIGNEYNAIYKDPDEVAIRFVMCFPDVYEIGMSHLGIQILYDMFNRMDDVWCERVYSPWPDLHRIMKEKQIPLFSLESQKPVRQADFLGITLQYEMCYTNVLQILDLSGIPLLARERTEEDPIVIGGGPCVYNPEPLADFFDLFYIGEGETSYRELLDLYKQIPERNSFLKAAAKIPGIYVPSLYECTYDGAELTGFAPIGDAPEKITRQLVTDYHAVPYPEKPVVPFIQATQDRVVLEIMRGCIRGCRFCQAGMIYRPARERALEDLCSSAVSLLRNTGYDEISLSSLSSSDYSQLKELIDFLIGYCKENRINISLPSLRVDAFSLDVMQKVQDVKKSSLTFAPEAGSQRMRNVINKGLTEEDILNGVTQAFTGGWNKVKLYFMLGLPGEEEEDMLGIAHLSELVAKQYYETVPKDKRQGRCTITASSSFFIPKPWTPFQWARMNTKEECINKARMVKQEFRSMLNAKSLHYQYHEPDISMLEGVLARGDRRIGRVILYAYENGAIFDAWSEFYDHARWENAMDACGLKWSDYLRERSIDELLPWDFIDTGVNKAFLIREWERAQQGIVTENCRKKCAGCGVLRFQTGCCPGGEM